MGRSCGTTHCPNCSPRSGQNASTIADAKKHPEFAGNVKAVDSRDLWREAADSPVNQGYHYNHNAETYMEVGLRLGWAMTDLLVNKK